MNDMVEEVKMFEREALEQFGFARRYFSAVIISRKRMVVPSRTMECLRAGSVWEFEEEERRWGMAVEFRKPSVS